MSGLYIVTGLALATTAALVVIPVATDAIERYQKENENYTMVFQNYSMDDLLDPEGPEVQFILFSRDDYPYNMILGDNDSFKNSPLNISHPTKIIIHGFLSSIKENIFIINRDAYLDTGWYNVVGMDWSVLCEFEYLSAIRGVRRAGNVLAEFIRWLIGNGVPADDIHLIGHSLGAHVAAIGSDKAGRVGRISGLDPANPGFKSLKEDYKLDPKDAKLVDVIHTDMHILGMAKPMGHIDFYPNGGRQQRGCPDLYDIWQLGQSLYCNHARAYEYFAESIRNQNGFKSRRCNTIDDAFYQNCSEETNVHMGNADTYGRGLYYVKTRKRRPFSLQ